MAVSGRCSSAMRVTTVIGAVVIWVCVIAKIIAVRSIVIHPLNVVTVMAVPKIAVVQNIMMMRVTRRVVVGVVTVRF